LRSKASFRAGDSTCIGPGSGSLGQSCRFSGLRWAQYRLGDYYDHGVGVAKDPVAAYMWLEIAVRTVSGDRLPTMGALYKGYRDALIERITTENIAEGKRRAADSGR